MKGKEKRPDVVEVKTVRPLDEDAVMNGKKNGVLDAEFTEPPKPEAPPSVGFLQLYRFTSTWERCLLLVGVLGTAGSAACTPLNVLFFGDLTGVMVNYGIALAGAVNISDPAAIAQATDIFMQGISDFAVNNALIGAGMLAGTYVAIALFNYVGHCLIFRVRGLYLKSALQQDVGWYDLNQSGDLASRMSEDLFKLEDGVGEKVPMFLHMAFSFVGSVILAFIKGWELTLICLISLPVTMISIGLVAFASSRLAKKELVEYGKAGAIAEEVISSIRTVIAFGGHYKETDRYEKNLVSARDISIKRNFFNGLGFGILFFFIYASYALAFWYGVGLIIRDMDMEDPLYDASTMTTVFFGVMTGSMMFGMASPYIDAFSIARGAAAKVYAVIDRQSPIDSMSEEGERPLQVEGSLRLKDIHFEYPSRKNVQVLRGLNLSIRRGETVALVGSSGCGKSTCIQLIQRFYDPREGTVELDSRDIRTLNVGWLRSQIGVVGQEPVLFQTTIAENIRYGRDDATIDEIVEAAKMANAHGFITKLPQGYDTLVGERGAQISGGQKQRIAIARALVRRPKILLLDEATSALDTGSEAKVQAALDRASVGRTTIIVAHRLSTIRNADKIVVISEGRVVEEGPHDKLMALQGHYYNLVTAQISAAATVPTTPASGEDGDHLALQRMVSVRSEASSVGEVEEDFLSPALVAVAEKYREEPVEPVGVFDIVKLNRPEWWLIAVASLCAVISGCAMPVFSVLFGNVLGALSGNDPETIRDETNWLSLLFVIIGVINGFATFAQAYMFGIAGEKLTMRIRGLMFSAIMRQEVAYFDDKNNSTGALCARLSSDAANIQAATGQRIGSVMQSVATVVLAVGLAMYYEWRLGLLTLAFAPLLFAAYFMQGRLQRGSLFGHAKAMERATKLAVEAVSNIRTVVGLNRERQFHLQYVLELTPSFQQAKRNVHLRAVVYGLARSIAYFAYAAAMYYGGTLIANEGIPYETIFKVSQSLIMGTTMVASILSFAPNFQKGLDAAAKAFHLMNRKPRVDDPPNASDDKWDSRGEVNYSQVEFAYPTRITTLVLRGLDMEIKPGQTVALVGPSGCGKSTCIQLLERFYDPVTGTVRVDGRDITSVTMKSLRAQLGIVSQEPVLFDRTIAENIAYGDNSREVPMAEVIEAAKKANIHNFITSLPQGYDTSLGEKGTQLSGGQKQRVAIARALVRNPRVLLLDEATSALDTESEKVVQEALDKAKEGRTCITIAHRLTTVQDADVICVINEGRVAEKGRHQELLDARGIYHKLHSLQAGRR